MVLNLILKFKFNRFKKKLDNDSSLCYESNLNLVRKNKYYLKLKQLENCIVPLLLQDLKKKPN